MTKTGGKVGGRESKEVKNELKSPRNCYIPRTFIVVEARGVEPLSENVVI